MTPGLRTAILVPALLALLLAPVVAEAQRRAVVRVPPARSSAAVSRQGGRYYAPYYRPNYYRPYYYRPYAYYDPFFYGSFSFGIGFGAGYPYGYYGYGYPYAAPYYGGYGGYPYPPYASGYYNGGGSLRLQVTPRETQVYIDGYYAGIVDQFDGTFQRLYLEPGQHDLQLYLPGHRTYSQKIYLQPVNTFTVRYAMPALAAGDPEPVRPTPQTPPPSQGYGPPQTSRRPPARSAPARPGDRDEDQNRVSASPSEFGTLALLVQPGNADVTIDGEHWKGPSDNEHLIVQLGSGVHNVQIRKEGFRTYNTDVTVRRGETMPLNVSLTKQ